MKAITNTLVAIIAFPLLITLALLMLSAALAKLIILLLADRIKYLCSKLNKQ